MLIFLRLLWTLAKLQFFMSHHQGILESNIRLLFSTCRVLMNALIGFPSHQIHLWALQSLCKFPAASAINILSLFDAFANVSDLKVEEVKVLVTGSQSIDSSLTLSAETSDFLREQFHQALLSSEALFSILLPPSSFVTSDVLSMGMESVFCFISGVFYCYSVLYNSVFFCFFVFF